MRWLVATLVLAGLGCQRVADEKADYGPEVSRADLNRALARAMTGVRAADARVGTTIRYQTIRRVGDQPRDADLGATSVAVVGEVTEGPRRTLRLQVDRRTRDESGAFKATRAEETLSLDVVTARAAALPPNARVTYHRLRTAEEAMPAPAAVRARPGCGGLPGCVMHVRFVMFDIVSRPADGGEARKTTLTLGLSAQTPYLPHGDGFDRFDGALVLECRASTVRALKRGVVVRDCRTLTDFER